MKLFIWDWASGEGEHFIVHVIAPDLVQARLMVIQRTPTSSYQGEMIRNIVREDDPKTITDLDQGYVSIYSYATYSK